MRYPQLRHALPVLLSAALLLGACSSLGEQVSVDWSTITAQALVEEGVAADVVECVLNVARRDLERGLLSDVATDEVLRHCRTARAVIDGATVDDLPDTELALTDVAWTFGDDPALDQLWAFCEQGSGSACDELFETSPIGSEYEDFGVSCGRRPDVLNCRELDVPESVDQP